MGADHECTEAPAQDVPTGAPGADSCTLTFTDGTGALEGATGSATLTAACPVASHPDGSASAFAMVKTFDLILPQ
jgi:hypothetical protein